MEVASMHLVVVHGCV